MRYQWRNNSVVIVHNLSAIPREVKFKPDLENGKNLSLINLLSDDHSAADTADRHCIVVEGYDYWWYRAGSMNYLERRSDA